MLRALLLCLGLLLLSAAPAGAADPLRARQWNLNQIPAEKLGDSTGRLDQREPLLNL